MKSVTLGRNGLNARKVGIKEAFFQFVNRVNARKVSVGFELGIGQFEAGLISFFQLYVMRMISCGRLK